MNSNFSRRKARLTIVVGLAAAVAVGFATPAFAASGSTSSFSLKTGGLVTVGPLSASSCNPGTCTPDSLASASVPGVLSFGVLDTTATATGASASVADLSVLAGINATVISSQCSINPTTGGVSGSASLVNATVTTPLGGPISIVSNPAPNTSVVVLNPSIASIVLNRQTTAADGTLTVDAVYISLLNLQTITISSSSCAPRTAGVPMASGNGLLLGGGLLGMMVLGYLGKRRWSLAKHTA